MAVARVAALALVFLTASLAAQQPSPIPVSVKVTDMSGAIIPGASVRVDSPLDSPNPAKTDKHGEVILNLTPGVHNFHVLAPGFMNWKKHVDVREASFEGVQAQLEVAQESRGPVVEDVTGEPVIESLPPLKELIPLQSLESLPLVGVKFHRRHHLLWF